MNRAFKVGLVVGAAVAGASVVRAIKQTASRRRDAQSRDELLNEAIDESFPASDPPSHTATTAAAAPAADAH